MPVAARPLTRRAALALGAAAATALTACDVLSDPSDPGASATPDADTVLVDETVAKITATAAVAASVPALTTMHAAHLAVLEPPSSGSPSPTQTPSRTPGPPATGVQVRAAERDLQTYLSGAALRAESGPLARLLASMSAAVAQQLVALRRELR